MVVRDRAGSLGIYLSLDDKLLRVGTLTRESSGHISFVVDAAYVALGPNRPTLSAAWRGKDEEDTRRRLAATKDKTTSGVFLPPFFANMLPEGALRELVKKELGTGDFDHFDVLARLGNDLPGAVVAISEFGGTVSRQPDETPAEGGIRFSLSGVQLKFSMRDDRGTLTVPASDAIGGVILKTPSPKYERLPEMEFSAMALCRAIGIQTADAWLVDGNDINGIPAQFLPAGQPCLAVRRFDRTPHGRVQIEDFAQILGAFPDQKYGMANQETVFNVIGRFSTDRLGEVLEAVRRFVANVMLGNGDCHLKNWSLLYGPNGHVALTPAYDVVPTVLYGDRELALDFGGSNNSNLVNDRRFERLAGYLGILPRRIVQTTHDTVRRILDVWPDMMDDLPIADRKEEIIKHWADMDIVKTASPEWAWSPTTTLSVS